MERKAQAILDAVLQAANPASAVTRELDVHPVKPTHVFATGKGSIAMARGAIERFGTLPGVVTCVPEHEPRDGLASDVLVLPADHPLPTKRNLFAADAVESFALGLREQDALLALISGGGSAHLASPVAGISLEDLRIATNTLLRAGATINELNAVRKHCERLKGGNLARLSHPAAIHCLVISDVIGNRLDTISSGPFAPDETTYSDALRCIERRGMKGIVPAIRDHLKRGARGEIQETPKPGDSCFDRVTAQIIASNRTAVDAAAGEASRLGFPTIHVRHEHTGTASDLGRELAQMAIEYQQEHPDDPAAIVVGGETTVDVQGATGIGGRNQEVALAAAIGLAGVEGVTILSFGTDGIDGPTDAAGGVVDGNSVALMQQTGIDPEDALTRHDSHTALAAARCLIKTGPTGTNVNDIALALIDPRRM